MDAAFASHIDLKSQSGIVVFLGGAMVFGASRKQKCMTKSVILLETKYGRVVQTKHHRVQMNLCREAVQEKRIKVEYINTSKMLADGLTKVFERKEFISFCNNLHGT